MRRRSGQDIYAGNGGYDDFTHTRDEELVTFALMECGGGDDTWLLCFQRA